MATEFPNSYRDPLYASLDAKTEAKLGLPEGLLSSIRTNGEKSNNDQVSSASARTPYQVTPTTRDLIVKKYGVDPYLSPETASEAAGLLLKEGLDRNKGDASQAVAEYVGGTDRNNWGKTTNAYVNRVMTGLSAAAAPTAAPRQSTFDRVSAQMDKPQDASMSTVLKAYQSGQMSPEDAKTFEGEVNAGRVMLPRGASLNGTAAPSGAPEMPNALAVAYQSGQMDPKDRAQLDDLIKQGVVAAPKGASQIPGQTEGAPSDVSKAVPETSLGQKIVGTGEAALNAVTGVTGGTVGAIGGTIGGIYDAATTPGLTPAQMDQRIAQGAERGSQALTYQPRTASGQDQAAAVGNVMQNAVPLMGMSGEMASLGHAVQTATPAAQVTAAAIPSVARDAVGTAATNVAQGVRAVPERVMQAVRPTEVAPVAPASPVAAATRFAVNPDDPLGAGVPYTAEQAPATPAPSVAVTSGNNGTWLQAASPEGVVGGSVRDGTLHINHAEIAEAARGQGIGKELYRALIDDAHAKGLKVVSDSTVEMPAVNVYKSLEREGYGVQRNKGGGELPPDEDLPHGALYGAGAKEPVFEVTPPVAAPAVAPVAPTMAAQDLANTAKAAASKGVGSTQAAELARQTSPDAATVAAAKRLGIEEYLQPDHVTSSQTYREFAQALKSLPTSEARAAEIAGLEKVGARAEKVITDIGGSTDVSQTSTNVRSTLDAAHENYSGQSERLYAEANKLVPKRMEAPPKSTLRFLESQARDVGGADRLLPAEKRLLSTLSGEDGRPVSYAFLDQTRKQIGQAMEKKSGPFVDSESGLLKKLYSTLSEDQTNAVKSVGDEAFYTYKAAQYAHQLKKGIEDDLSSLFGKNLDQSMTSALRSATGALAQGDGAKLAKLMASVPQSMRQEVAASGVATAFRTASTREPISFTQFSKWYDGLLRNKQAYNALMSNLAPAARKQLSDLYRVSKGISAASRERITTGRIQAFKEMMTPADTLAARLYDAGKRNAVAATAGTAAGFALGPGVGAAVTSAMMKGPKAPHIVAADALIASPEFAALARSGPKPSPVVVKKVAYSPAFKRYAKALGNPPEMKNPEDWVRNVIYGAALDGSGNNNQRKN